MSTPIFEVELKELIEVTESLETSPDRSRILVSLQDDELHLRHLSNMPRANIAQALELKLVELETTTSSGMVGTFDELLTLLKENSFVPVGVASLQEEVLSDELAKPMSVGQISIRRTLRFAGSAQSIVRNTEVLKPIDEEQ